MHRGPQQWLVQGRGRGDAATPLLFLNQTEAQGPPKKFFLETAPPTYLSAWMTATHLRPPHPPCPALSEGQDPPLLNYLFLIPLGLYDREITIKIHVI